jgi:hypothetical protein
MLLATGAVAAASLIGAAVAQEGPPVPVSFEDPTAALSGADAAAAPGLDVSVRDNSAQRFAPVNPGHDDQGERPRRLELEVAAGGVNSPLDVSVAQRASFGADENGNVDRRGRGSEVRVGRGLVRDNRERSNDRSAVYMFVASDDEALTWQPGSRSEFGGNGGGLALEDRVEVGDLSAGVTYERNGVQASLAYVEREEATRVGNQSFNQDQSFAGVTVTMRR